MLPKALRHPYLVGFGCLGLVLASLFTVGTIVPFEFQPNTEYGAAVAASRIPSARRSTSPPPARAHGWRCCASAAT